jgi:hypothetical protein
MLKAPQVSIQRDPVVIGPSQTLAGKRTATLLRFDDDSFSRQSLWPLRECGAVLHWLLQPHCRGEPRAATEWNRNFREFFIF